MSYHLRTLLIVLALSQPAIAFGQTVVGPQRKVVIHWWQLLAAGSAIAFLVLGALVAAVVALCWRED